MDTAKSQKTCEYQLILFQQNLKKAILFLKVTRKWLSVLGIFIFWDKIQKITNSKYLHTINLSNLIAQYSRLAWSNIFLGHLAILSLHVKLIGVGSLYCPFFNAPNVCKFDHADNLIKKMLLEFDHFQEKSTRRHLQIRVICSFPGRSVEWKNCRVSTNVILLRKIHET